MTMQPDFMARATAHATFARALVVVALAAIIATAACAGTTYYAVPGGAGSYTGTSWGDACANPQDAVNLASSGDEVWVAAGIYTNNGGGSSTATVLAMKDGVACYGGFDATESSRDERNPSANITTLDGEDIAYHVIVGASNTVIDGFTIVGGNAQGSGSDGAGAGILWESIDNVSVVGCVIKDNDSAGTGGGLHAYLSANASIRDSCFDTCSSGIGGGIYLNNASPTIVSCVFATNMSSNFGGAIAVHQAGPQINNCTFVGNSAASWGGAINFNENTPGIANCIFLNNTSPLGADIRIMGVANLTVIATRIDIAAGAAVEGSSTLTDGGGNIAAAPGFVNVADTDGADGIWMTADDGLRVLAASPCIDSGWGDSGVTVPNTDILGNARHDDTGTADAGAGTPTFIDMGAYEFQEDSLYVTAPNGTETWQRGKEYTVTWTPTGQGGNVMIEVGHMGTDPVTMPEGEWTDSTAGTGTPNDTDTYCPAARNGHSAVWTGTRMVIWGGWTGSVELGDGAVYDPVGDSWESGIVASPGSPSERCHHAAVWTGSRMLIWGGSSEANTGAVYNPATVVWESATSTSGGTLEGRTLQSSIWTDSHMVVWGGEISGIRRNTGTRYDPSADSWGPSTATGTWCPTARTVQSAVWARTRMVVWGGWDSTGRVATGAIYDLVADTWLSETSTSGACPTARGGHSATWTGSCMVVWGGSPSTSVYELTGALYDHVTDTWVAPTSTTGDCPSARSRHSAIWTGTRMVVWGGIAGGMTTTGAFYDPPGWHTQKILTASTPDDGSFTATNALTADLSIGTEYRIRVTHLGNGSYDDSDADFSITEWPPAVTTDPVDDTVDERLDATFDVVAEGNGPLYYQWERSDDGGGAWNDIDATANASAATASLTVTGVVLSDDTAQFRCRVMSNDGMYPVGHATSAVATLTVTDLADIYYVDGSQADDLGDGRTSWSAAKATIQAANALAGAADEIWVAAGTYTNNGGGSSTDTVLVMNDGVEYYGGFDATESARNERDPVAIITTLDGEDIAYHVVVGASDTAIDGFTIRGGNAQGSGDDAYGAGVLLESLDNVSIRSCVIRDNYASVRGGGLRDYLSSNFTIDNSCFVNCSSPNGGAMNLNNSYPFVASCVFAGNTAVGSGGAIAAHQAGPSFMNCTFADNSATVSGGAIGFHEYSPLITNCIFSGNISPLGSDIRIAGVATTTVTNTRIDIAGGVSVEASSTFDDGGGNIATGPGFADAAAPNGPDDKWMTSDDGLQLDIGSPCIDAGLGDSYATVPAADILDHLRYDDPATEPNTGTGTPDYVDMGAYERAGPGVLVLMPNGSETWDAGATQTITWLSAAVAIVRIELSRDGNWTDGDGSDVETIVASMDAATGTYQWQASEPASTTCLIRVVDAAGSAPFDVSDATFGISSEKPWVVSSAPADGADEVMLKTSVDIVFSEAMDRASVTLDPVTGSFKLADLAGAAVLGSASWSVDDKTLTFTPADELEFDALYTVTITTAVTDAAANPLAEACTSQFTTRAQTEGWFGGGGCAPGTEQSAAALVLLVAVVLALKSRRVA